MVKVSGIAAALLLLTAGSAQAVTLASQNFENGDTSGWAFANSSALATISDPGTNSGGFTKHLGRFGALENLTKTIDLSGNQTSVNIKFDFYRLDSWDNEALAVRIIDEDGNDLVTDYRYYTWGGGTNYVYESYDDAIFNYNYDLTTSTTSLTVVISSFATSAINDESFGIDNFFASDDTIATPGGEGAVPEPASWALMLGGFGMIGGALRNRRRAIRFA